MHTTTQHISALDVFYQHFHAQKIPQQIVNEALSQNAWFTDFYIQSAFQGILSWLRQDTLTTFLAKYPSAIGTCKTVGVITAGNVPFVGLHDILMILLSGHRAQVKCSHQDSVLMHFFWDALFRYVPTWRNQLTWVEKIEKVDFLIATGSNNTALHIEASYPSLSLLLRKNRFSIAWWGDNTPDAEGLARDILLYNGLGCRNVSIVCMRKGTSIAPLIEALSHYSSAHLSPHYTEKVQWERAKMRVSGEEFIDAHNVLIKKTTEIAPSVPGILYIWECENEAAFTQICTTHQASIQCVVGQEISFGKSQNPDLHDFADNIDTFQLLLQL